MLVDCLSIETLGRHHSVSPYSLYLCNHHTTPHHTTPSLHSLQCWLQLQLFAGICCVHILTTWPAAPTVSVVSLYDHHTAWRDETSLMIELLPLTAWSSCRSWRSGNCQRLRFLWVRTRERMQRTKVRSQNRITTIKYRGKTLNEMGTSLE